MKTFKEEMFSKEVNKKLRKELEHYYKTKIPRCMKCKKNMVNAVDSKTKKISKYLWGYNCNCSSNDKGARLSIG